METLTAPAMLGSERSAPSFADFLEYAASELGLQDQARNSWIRRTKEMLTDIGVVTVKDVFINIYDMNTLLFNKDHDLFNKKTSRALLAGDFTIYCAGQDSPSLMEMLRKAAVEIEGYQERREPWCQQSFSRLRDIGVFQVRDLVVKALEINTKLRELHKHEFSNTQLAKTLRATYKLLYIMYWDKRGAGTTSKYMYV